MLHDFPKGDTYPLGKSPEYLNAPNVRIYLRSGNQSEYPKWYAPIFCRIWYRFFPVSTLPAEGWTRSRGSLHPRSPWPLEHWMNIVSTAQTRLQIDDIINMPKGEQPSPSTYHTQDYIDRHLDLFKNKVTKMQTSLPCCGCPAETNAVRINTGCLADIQRVAFRRLL